MALHEGAGGIGYAELDARANRLAHWLQAEGCQPGALVGVLARRENAFAVAALAVWKAGCAYVPLDPDYPAERIAHIVADAGLDLLLG
ncbi:AMP-binding protein, partial [Pseudomonas sp. BAY1663]|uniref:AMP-binding protein n=1 Tax=Pseudomonas sp. BAY1663 TaxID=1439940 RepID=UPI0027389090